jgi:hypothetical protein
MPELIPRNKRSIGLLPQADHLGIVQEIKKTVRFSVFYGCLLSFSVDDMIARMVRL